MIKLKLPESTAYLVSTFTLFILQLLSIHQLCASSVSSFAQQQQTGVEIKGIVRNEQGVLPNVNISVKGNSRLYTVTDLNGEFILSVPDKASGLIFQMIGYQTREVSIDGKPIDLVLQASADELDEVVVVGYGTQRRADLTGSIQRVDAKVFENQSPTNFVEMLTGTVAGFQSNQTTSAQGGGSMLLRGQKSIKASNDPLVVLDGVIYNGVLSDINPNDIQSIDVLKDASAAAVYGSRAAAGVLIVTTKRGRSGKPAFTFSTDFGVSSARATMRTLTAEEFILHRGIDTYHTYGDKPLYYYQNPNDLPEGISLETWKNLDPTPSDDPVDMWLNRLRFTNIEKKNYLAGTPTDWYDEIFRHGMRQDHNLGLSGGSDYVNYYLSSGYTKNQGILLGDDFSAFRSKINLDVKATNFLKFFVDVNYSNRNMGGQVSALGQATAASPFGDKYNADSTLSWYPNGDISAENPLIYYAYRERFHPSENLFATISAELNLPFGIKYKPSLVSNRRWVRDYQSDPKTTPIGYNNNGSASRANTTVNDWMVDNLLIWERTFSNSHTLNATFLYNIEKNQYWYDMQSNTQFAPNDALGYHSLQSGINPLLVNDDIVSTGTALMGRLNYSYQSKYLLTLTARRDGFSAFGQNNPYATFPSVAAAWRITDESFFKVPSIDELKLRVSWGANGNRSIGPYEALSRLASDRYIYGTQLVTGVYSNTMANSNLKWESTQASNIGLDFGLFGRRLTGTIDGYLSSTTDLLINRTLPPIIGYASVSSNLGEIQNKGLEVTLNSQTINKKDFSWNSSLVFSLNRNKIKRLYGDMTDIFDGEGNVVGQREADDVTNGWFIGQSIDRIWDYEVMGIWQDHEVAEAHRFGKTPGDIKLKDQDGDGVLTPMEDKVFQGYRRPQYNVGFRNDITYKNFSLAFFIRADLAFQRNNPLYLSMNGIDRTNILYASYWTEENPSQEFPKLNSNITAPGFNVWKNTSFARLQDLSFAYNFSEDLVKRFQLQRMRVYVNVRNLATVTNWNNWDPESGTLPMPRSFNVGLNASF